MSRGGLQCWKIGGAKKGMLVPSRPSPGLITPYLLFDASSKNNHVIVKMIALEILFFY